MNFAVFVAAFNPGHYSCVNDKKLIPSLEEDGLIRAHGRLEDTRSLPREMRNPIILPHDYLLVKLLLRHLHKRTHCGYKSLIHEARRTYWMIGLRNMSKALTVKCVTCRKHQARGANFISVYYFPPQQHPSFGNQRILNFGVMAVRDILCDNKHTLLHRLKDGYGCETWRMNK